MVKTVADNKDTVVQWKEPIFYSRLDTYIYIYISLYHYIIIYLRQSCPIPNALGCFSLVPFVGGTFRSRHGAMKPQAPKHRKRGGRGGKGEKAPTEVEHPHERWRF